LGRLCDAAACLLGARQTVTYEGQATLELEALARDGQIAFPRFRPAGVEIDPAPVLERIAQGGDVPALAWAFHDAVAELILTVALRAREELGLAAAALTGGVFQNVLLLRLAAARLESAGFRVLTHRIVPPNDGGLSLGQALCV
jgi:hydrogenase maturation protein HypF